MNQYSPGIIVSRVSPSLNKHVLFVEAQLLGVELF
jgi:hypothetical protein